MQQRFVHLCMPAKQQLTRGQNVYIKHGSTQLHDCSLSSRVFATVFPADRCLVLAIRTSGRCLQKSEVPITPEW